MFWWLAAMILVLVAVQLASLRVQRRDHSFEKSAMAVQALATTLALMFAGYWYLYDRKGQPQANTSLEVVGLKVTDDLVALEARFTISNLGATLLQVGQSDVRLQTMNADSLPFAAIEKLGGQSFPAMVEGRDAFDDGVLMWPTVRWFRGGVRRSIEPGETDLKIVDFLASCRNTAMRIYFAMLRPGSDQAWSDQAVLGLSDLCSKKVGTKEVLSDKRD